MQKIVKKNLFAFTWHAFFLAIAETFSERNTVLPGLILLAGGTSADIGILTAISIGVPLVSQLFFSGFLSGKERKKGFLIFGILVRVFAFLAIASSFSYVYENSPQFLIYLVFAGIFLFSISGAFAGISYNDIVGKSFIGSDRKKFYVRKQLFASIGILISAILVRTLISEIEYPLNYKLSFFVAGGLLFIASIGFMMLKEKPSPSQNSKMKFINVIKSIPSEIKSNSNLKLYLISSNLLGLSVTLLPFYIAFAKQQAVFNDSMIGNYLLIQILGMVASNYLWKKLLGKYSFKGMLKITHLMYAMVGLSAIIISQIDFSFFFIVFLFSGFSISAYKISFDGVLMEISNEENRVLYSGIIGTFNLTTALFPLITGQIAEVLNYEIIFFVFAAATLSGIYFISKMKCPVDLKPVSV